MSIEQITKDTTYCSDPKLNALITQQIQAIQSGNSGATIKVIKNQPTQLLRASSRHDVYRYRPGSVLITYNGIDNSGQPIQETWGGGTANINEDSVILRNTEPICYPKDYKDPELAGKPVRGYYLLGGTFVVDPKKPYVTLFNEYVSTAEDVRKLYGVDATEEWQEALKLSYSYVFKIPEGFKDVFIDPNDKNIKLSSGDYVVIDAKDGKVTSVHGIEASWFDKTYVVVNE